MRKLELQLDKMLRSEVRNYATAGLTSFLVGGEGKGQVRFFEAERDTTEFITPHSHRFDFACLVLKGAVVNTVFKRSQSEPQAELWVASELRPLDGGLGKYEFRAGEFAEKFVKQSEIYQAFDTYAMKADDIHTISFQRDSQVLFLEGPIVRQKTVVLEPWAYGARVPTFKSHEWMFERGDIA